MENADKNVVAGFGDEWTRFDQSEMSPVENREFIFIIHDLPLTIH